ncbi:hypothetical protein [Thauera aromatica]|uniref:hypothetical protein n=1 Tax=Thauera aromatica TaxID=59405 RepID=UPI001FFD8FBF|nr:hypothetical protein [Thauera aromatica]MCK2097523.1 hypothetical protein [Thauera aromatica]
MAALSALHPYILPHVPNVPEMAIDRAIVDGAIQFCRDTLAWQQTLDPLRVMPGVRDYDIEPMGAEPVRVLAAVLADVAALDRTTLAGADLTRVGTPAAFVQPAPRLLQLVETPRERSSLVLRVAVEPTMGAASLDDGLVRYWREPIAAAALVRLQLTYGDAARAQTAEQAYRLGADRATAQAQTGLARGRLRTRPVP